MDFAEHRNAVHDLDLLLLPNDLKPHFETHMLLSNRTCAGTIFAYGQVGRGKWIDARKM